MKKQRRKRHAYGHDSPLTAVMSDTPQYFSFPSKYHRDRWVQKDDVNRPSVASPDSSPGKALHTGRAPEVSAKSAVSRIDDIIANLNADLKYLKKQETILQHELEECEKETTRIWKIIHSLEAQLEHVS